MSRVTIRDVAQEAGVSISSVSRFLSGDVRYRPETEERISNAAARLGYRANSAARLLRQSNTNMVGIAVHSALLIDPIVVALVLEAQRELQARGLQPILVEPEHMVPAFKAVAFPSPDLLQGIISADFTLEESVPEFYASLQEKLPIVAMYLSACKTVDCVTVDRKAAIIQAVGHLAALGHRNVAFAGGTTDSISQKPKVQGWRSAQRKFALDSRAELEIELPSALDIPARGELAAQVLLKLVPRPTAVVCSSDILALHLLKSMGLRGVRVPGEISVVGFDGHVGGETSWPPLTTVAQPVAEITAAAVKRFGEIREFKTGDQNWAPITRLIQSKLVVRSSTAPLRP